MLCVNGSRTVKAHPWFLGQRRSPPKVTWLEAATRTKNNWSTTLSDNLIIFDDMLLLVSQFDCVAVRACYFCYPQVAKEGSWRLLVFFPPVVWTISSCACRCCMRATFAMLGNCSKNQSSVALDSYPRACPLRACPLHNTPFDPVAPMQPHLLMN